MEKELDKIIEGTDKKFSVFEKLLYNTIINYFVGGLNINESRVTLTDNNRRLINSLDQNTTSILGPAFNAIKTYILNSILEYVGLGIKSMKRYDVRAIEVSNPVIDRIKKHSSTTVNTVLNLERLFLEVKEQSVRLMARPEGISLKELRDQLQSVVVDKGLAQKYYKRWTHDIYSQYERVAANEVRITLGLRFAVYQGGLIRDSRSFCIQINDKCFIEDEIKKWKNLNWIGKPESGYDPITDLGGYNCRHRLDWISDNLGYRLRPDLDPRNKGKKVDYKLYNELPKKEKTEA
jgi:hypothetical protein